MRTGITKQYPALYSNYRSMLNRCYLPTTDSYPDYGGRGIKVCNIWRGENGFENYLAYVLSLGPKPSPKHSLDREDNEGDYEPGNLRWADVRTQLLNRRYLKQSNTKIKGVTYDKRRNRYFAKFYYDHKMLFIGSFFTQKEARLQYEYVSNLFDSTDLTLHDKKAKALLLKKFV